MAKGIQLSNDKAVIGNWATRHELIGLRVKRTRGCLISDSESLQFAQLGMAHFSIAKGTSLGLFLPAQTLASTQNTLCAEIAISSLWAKTCSPTLLLQSVSAGPDTIPTFEPSQSSPSERCNWLLASGLHHGRSREVRGVGVSQKKTREVLAVPLHGSTREKELLQKEQAPCGCVLR